MEKQKRNQTKENPDTQFSVQTENKLMERKEEDIVCLDESFFINDDYQLTKFTFGSQVLELLCLQSASTDFDLTGQLVWPGAILLNDYLSKNVEMLRGSSIIELGSGVAGCLKFLSHVPWHKKQIQLAARSPQHCLLILHGQGVTGILCSRFCREIVLTDHNEEVLKILRKNIELHIPSDNSNSSAGIIAEKLEWGDSAQLNQILHSRPRGFDLILGADIYESRPDALNMPEKNLSEIFALELEMRMDVRVTSEALKHGLQINEIAGSRSIVGNLEGVIYEITLQ